MDFEVKIEGMEEINKTIQELTKSMDPNKVEPILMKGAKKMASSIRANAPVGPTGNLKKAVKAKQLKRWGKQPAPAIAAVDRKKAPHAHLVEFGTTGVRVDKKTGRTFGRMPANPFFRRTVDEKSGGIAKEIEQNLTKLAEEAAKK